MSLADGGGASARGLTHRLGHGLGHRATGALAPCSPSKTNTMLGAELEAQVCTPSAPLCTPSAPPLQAPLQPMLHPSVPLCTPLHPLRTPSAPPPHPLRPRCDPLLAQLAALSSRVSSLRDGTEAPPSPGRAEPSKVS